MPRRVTQIDVLKGLAIVGVMVQHAFATSLRHRAWDTLYAEQAVPVFFVILGLNASRSLARGNPWRLAALYSRRYLGSRVDRLLKPFLLIWPLAAVVGVFTNQVHVGALVVVGLLPIARPPGNYFVTILFEFAVCFPLVIWFMLRAPRTTTFVLIALNVGFELIAPHIAAFSRSGVGQYAYESAIVKYATAIVAGFWLSRVTVGRTVLLRLTPAAAGSVLYLVLLHLRPGDFNWLVNSFSRPTSFLCVPYTVWLTCLGLALLPSQENSTITRGLASLGRASYHVFLVQLIWFGIVGSRSWPLALSGIALCSLLGFGFFELLTPSHPAVSQNRSRSAPEG